MGPDRPFNRIGEGLAMAVLPKENRVVRFKHRPQGGPPTPDVFALETVAVSELGEGEFLLRNNFLSMDPALVSRMRDEDNYTDKVEPGEVMHCYGVGQVIASKNPAVKMGEVRFGRVDMQEYTVSNGAGEFTALNLGLAQASWYLSAVGITGATAYLSLFGICKPQPGETILISSAGSSVGTLVAQLCQNIGCRTVGIVSTDEKAGRVKNDWGYDAVVSYRGKSIDALSSDIGAVCPEGVDVYYDNTSGDISEAVLDHYRDYARIAVIGRMAISHLTDTRLDVGRRENNAILSKRLLKQGFVLLDHRPKFRGAFIMLARWIKEGKIKLREDVLEGIERTPEAFFRVLDGVSDGKQLVKLADIDDAVDPANRAMGRLLISRFFPTRFLAKRITGGI
jgi:NADPH-dependent curcumin reductase CurA